MDIKCHCNSFSLTVSFKRIYCYWETEAFALETDFCQSWGNQKRLCQAFCLGKCKMKTMDSVIIIEVVCFLINTLGERVAQNLPRQYPLRTLRVGT